MIRWSLRCCVPSTRLLVKAPAKYSSPHSTSILSPRVDVLSLRARLDAPELGEATGGVDSAVKKTCVRARLLLLLLPLLVHAMGICFDSCCPRRLNLCGCFFEFQG